MTGPPPAVAAQRVAVRRALAALDPVLAAAPPLVLVACSGGADSLALAAALAFEAPRAGVRAGAVVVDHGLQAGSADVAARTAEVLAGLGLDPVVVRSVDVGHDGGPEAAARAARYAALGQVAAETEALAVLLGHTLDDQAETVLLGLARGSGARSLAGMPAVRGVFHRPFLGDVRRVDTEAACRALGLTPWDDPTNAPGGAPVRSRVRHEVLPVLDRVLGPGVAQALARSAEQLREDADALDALAQEHWEALSTRADADTETDAGIEMDVDALGALPTAIRRRVLRRAALSAGCPAGALHRSHVLALDALLTDWHGQGPVALPGGRQGRRGCGRLTVGTA